MIPSPAEHRPCGADRLTVGARVAMQQPDTDGKWRRRNVEMRVRADNETFREKATNVIREAIMSVHYKPGEALIERHLCDETGVSRTLVREALRLLEAEGLVRREGTRGLVVSELSVDEVRDMFDLRLILEIELLRRFVAQVPETDLDRMAPLLDGALAAAGRREDDYTRLLSRFVHQIWEGGGNAVAVQVLESLQSRISYIRVMLYRTTTYDEHQITIGLMRDVLTAARARQADEAAEVYRRYLMRARDRAIGIIEDRKASRPDARTRKVETKDK